MRDFSSARRIVIKAGTNILSSPSGIDKDRIEEIASEIARLREMGKQVLLVSSGAVGLGAKALGHTSPVVYIAMRQACAAIGQSATSTAHTILQILFLITMIRFLSTINIRFSMQEYDRTAAYLYLLNTY